MPSLRNFERTIRSGIRLQTCEGVFFLLQNVQISFGVHPSSCSMVTRGPSPGRKEVWVWS